MGSLLSTLFNRGQPALNNRRNDPLRSTGTYYGPNFVLERDEVPLNSNQTRAFWEDIVNLLSNNEDPVDLHGLRNLSDIYAQLPPAQLKTAITLQSPINLQRGSLQFVKEQSRSGYNLAFKFDSLHPCEIVIYWGSKESIQRDSNGKVSLNFNSKLESEIEPWKFGPFPAGLGQSFTLPSEYKLDSAFLRAVDMQFVTELDLNGIASPKSIEFDNVTAVSSTANSPPVQVTVEPVLETPEKSKPYRGTDKYHLIIELIPAAVLGSNGEFGSQATMVVFAPSNDRRIEISYLKKICLVFCINKIGNSLYTLQEVFGFTDMNKQDKNLMSKLKLNVVSQKECVVCMSEAKDTIVLPCRHLCLCQDCALVLREQGRTATGLPSRNGRPKCPMCRQIFHSLVHVKLPPPYNKRDSVASRMRTSLTSINLNSPTPLNAKEEEN